MGLHHCIRNRFLADRLHIPYAAQFGKRAFPRHGKRRVFGQQMPPINRPHAVIQFGKGFRFALAQHHKHAICTSEPQVCFYDHRAVCFKKHPRILRFYVFCAQHHQFIAHQRFYAKHTCCKTIHTSGSCSCVCGGSGLVFGRMGVLLISMPLTTNSNEHPKNLLAASDSVIRDI